MLIWVPEWAEFIVSRAIVVSDAAKKYAIDYYAKNYRARKALLAAVGLLESKLDQTHYVTSQVEYLWAENQPKLR